MVDPVGVYRIRFELRRKKLAGRFTVDAAAALPGLSRRTLYSIESGTEPKATTLGKLATALRVNVSEFYVRAKVA